jgi:hypothetical protein
MAEVQHVCLSNVLYLATFCAVNWLAGVSNNDNFLKDCAPVLFILNQQCGSDDVSPDLRPMQEEPINQTTISPPAFVLSFHGARQEQYLISCSFLLSNAAVMM